MPLSFSRWLPSMAALAVLACVAPEASANAKRALHPLAAPAARNATAAHATKPATPATSLALHHHSHGRSRTSHVRGTTLTVRRAMGSTPPARLPGVPKSHRAAAVPPTIAHRGPVTRHARGDSHNDWILPGQEGLLSLSVRDLRASECLVPMIATDPVWSGRGPPRAGPTTDHTCPPRPAPAGSDADPSPTWSARTTNPRLTSTTGVPKAASRCLLACRPEGTAAGSFMPSSGVEHVS
jgi:hypothetical protein